MTKYKNRKSILLGIIGSCLFIFSIGYSQKDDSREKKATDKLEQKGESGHQHDHGKESEHDHGEKKESSHDSHEHSKNPELKNSEKEDHSLSHDSHGHEEESLVKLTSQDIKEFGINLMRADFSSLVSNLVFPGEIEYNENNLIHVNTSYRGIAKTVNFSIGEKVKKGEILAVLQSTTTLENIYLKSPLSGVIISRHISIGEVISEESNAFTIANLDDLWVHLSIYQKDLSKIKIGQEVQIAENSSLFDKEFSSGKIFYISPGIDEATRNAVAKIKISNSFFRPGMFIVGRVNIGSAPVAINIPKSSLQNIEGKKVVFVKSKDSLTFKPTEVKVGKENQNQVEILHGINKEDVFVSDGSFILKAQLEKASFGHGHAH